MAAFVLTIDVLMIAAWTWVEFGILVVITNSNLLRILSQDSPDWWQLLLLVHNVLVYGALRYRFAPQTFGEWLCNHNIWK